MIRRFSLFALLLGTAVVPAGGAPLQAASPADSSKPSGADTLRMSPVLEVGGRGNLAERSSGWVRLAPDDLPVGESFEGTRQGRACVGAETDGSVVAVGRTVPPQPSGVVQLTWSWFLDEGIRGSSLHRSEADDFGARVLVNFRFEPDREGLLTRMGHALRGDLYGVPAPGSSLAYVWSLEDRLGQTARNPNTDRVATVVVSHAQDSGWVTLTRDVVRDYETIFGKPAPPITSIVLFSDSDDTGQRTRTCFGDLVLIR